MGMGRLANNWLPGIVILLPLTHMSRAAYFPKIGIRYRVIPIMSLSIGYVAGSKEGPSHQGNAVRLRSWE